MTISLPILTGAIGVVASGVLILFSYLIPRWFVSGAEHTLDMVRFGGRAFSKKESAMIGIFIHLVFSLFFGVIYGVGMNAGIFDLSITMMFVYSLVMTLVLGGILLPLEGHGLFGWKEDHWIAVDLFTANILWVLIFWALVIVLR
jgi:uncharacterized membrane protein YagU involved in acid resistance